MPQGYAPQILECCRMGHIIHYPSHLRRLLAQVALKLEQSDLADVCGDDVSVAAVNQTVDESRCPCTDVQDWIVAAERASCEQFQGGRWNTLVPPHLLNWP